MKQLMMTFLMAIALVACQTEKKDTVTTTDVDGTEVSNDTASQVAINTTESTIWYQGGKVVGNDSHNGNVPFSGGHFLVENNQVVGGEFTMSIADLTNDDIKDDEMKQKFLGHMKSADFFNTDEFPTASFKILGTEPIEGNDDTFNVTGTLTIKNNAKNITFPADIDVENGKVDFEAEFNIDRTDFGVNYGSPTKITDIAKDKAIKNAIELKVDAQS